MFLVIADENCECMAPTKWVNTDMIKEYQLDESLAKAMGGECQLPPQECSEYHDLYPAYLVVQNNCFCPADLTESEGFCLYPCPMQGEVRANIQAGDPTCACDASLELVEGECLPPCTGEFVRIGRDCACDTGKEEWKGTCLSICGDGEIRNDKGTCVCDEATHENFMGECLLLCDRAAGEVRHPTSGVCEAPQGGCLDN